MTRNNSDVDTPMETLIRLTELAALEEDEGICVELPDRPALAVFLHEGAVHVVDDQCTHGPASLSEGYCDDGEIECPFHMGRFCLATGEATYAPCHEPIAVHRSKVIDGIVYLIDTDRKQGAPAVNLEAE